MLQITVSAVWSIKSCFQPRFTGFTFDPSCISLLSSSLVFLDVVWKFSGSFAHFFLPAAELQRSKEGPFVSAFAPKAVPLQGRLIITEHTTLWKTIFNIFDVKHERNQNCWGKKRWRRKVLNDGSSVCFICWQRFLLLLCFMATERAKDMRQDVRRQPRLTEQHTGEEQCQLFSVTMGQSLALMFGHMTQM